MADDQTFDRHAIEAAVRAEQERVALQIADLTEELEAIVESAAATVPDDEHDAEGSTVGFERARVSALLERAVKQLAGLDAALEIDRGGRARICEACGAPIAVERILALPSIRLCGSCAAARPTRR